MIVLDSPDLYTIGWIAALAVERAAATAMLDERHEVPADFEQHPSDTNAYTWGRIGAHNVVIASLPAGVHGIVPAASTASSLLSSLPQIRIGLLVGIGGGVPRPDQGRDIRLGDVVVSQPSGTEGGVVQYDMGKSKEHETWERRGSLDKPPPVLLNALASLQAEHLLSPSQVPDLLHAMWTAYPFTAQARKNSSAFVYQGQDNDCLFVSTYHHVGGSDCTTCDESEEVERKQRETTDPQIHYGTIASGNILVADATTRDKIADAIGEHCICFDMEAAGLMNHFPCLVIRGICDYADSHKNDKWKPYASATAAAYAKELLGFVPAKLLQKTQRAVDVLESIGQNVKTIQVATADVKDQVQGVRAVLHDMDQKTVLRQLESAVAAGAAFDSPVEGHNPTCLPDTRVDLLKLVLGWALNPEERSIFWLNGMAGTGKSTISRTVARALAVQGRLGASFFFKRDETDRAGTSKFFPTIAADLTTSLPAMAPYIKEAMDSDPAILRKSVGDQFNKLLWNPLSSISHNAEIKQPLAIVVDALDECEQNEEIRILIHLFSRLKALNNLTIKFFLTSRPELPIQLGIKAIEGTYQDFILRGIPRSIIEHDIAAFLKHRLTTIREDYNGSVREDRRLPGDWPGQTNLEILVQMARPLFIFAATICRFIGDSRVRLPDCQLMKVLAHQTKSQESKLDATCFPVSNKLIDGVPQREQEHILSDFRDIVGSIVILSSPLSRTALAQMLDINRDDIDAMLDLLHSILDIPLSTEAPVRLLDLSFRDFLLDSEKRGKSLFWIDEKARHAVLAVNCLRVMGCLGQDVCRLGAPGIDRSDIDSRLVDDCLPPAVQYACLYWVHHLQAADAPNDADGYQPVLEFLECHFLHWLEALSLMGRIWEVIHLVKTLQSLFSHSASKPLRAFLDDAVRFVLANNSAIDATPLQLYSSLLVFSPAESIVRTTFQKVIAPWITQQPKVDRRWSECLLTLEGHKREVSSVAVSNDGALVASSSMDGSTRIWRTATGESLHTLEGDGDWTYAACFSHDSALVAFAVVFSSYMEVDSHHTIRICRVATGECTHIMRSRLVRPRAGQLAFSHDSALLVSVENARLKLWSTVKGECVRMLLGHVRQVLSVAFSSGESEFIASHAEDGTIRIWRTATGECLQTIEGNFCSIAFSDHDATLIAAGCGDGTLRIWRITTGRCLRELELGYPVQCLRFSKDDFTLISINNGRRNLKVLCGAACQDVSTIDTYCYIDVVAYSPQSGLIVSGSTDGVVRLWSMPTAGEERQFRSHSDVVAEVDISHDSTLVASSSHDTVRIWRASTGECVQTLESRNIFDLGDRWPRASAGSQFQSWRLATGHEVRVLVCQTDQAFALTFPTFQASEQVYVFAPPSGRGTLAFLTPACRYEMRIHDRGSGECLGTLASCVTSSAEDSAALAWSQQDPGCCRGRDSLDTTMRIWRVTAAESVQISHMELHKVPYKCIHKFEEASGVDRGRPYFLTHDESMAVPRPTFALIKDDRWVTWEGKRLFWLPAEYRPWSLAAADSYFAIGSRSGRFVIIGFSHREASKAFAERRVLQRRVGPD